ncbi:MAG: hypothetical protein SXA11_21240 [Cyanobacteriota bacterium]|nr:hypothetical protein [Cyanobacteriota bacterium]
MTQTTVKLQIPFESLVEAIASLGLEEKRQLWQLLDKEIHQTQSDAEDTDPYDWGPEGQPQGKPVEYLPGVGLAVMGGKDERY